MGTETFQKAKLSHLEFSQERPNVSNLPLPDELPKRADLSHLPKEILKSSTVENLISQNEDLMARLKVSLRRLSHIELENQKMTEEAHKIRLAQSSFSDQVMIWKEKDSRWKQKLDEIEREKEIQTEQLIALKEKVQIMNTDLIRHEKYHERIKNQVKPYITQLKEYSQTQEIKIKDLENSLAHKEAQVRDIRHQIIEVTKNSRFQVEATEKKSQELIKHYETQLESMTAQLQKLQNAQDELDVKSLKLNAALEKQDTLANEVITIRRSKEELKERLTIELQQIQQRQTELSRQNQKLGVEHADMQIRVMEDHEKLQKLEADNREQFEQLEGLRFMWTAKNEENEKLKMAMSALEKLNIELSQKLNELRR